MADHMNQEPNRKSEEIRQDILQLIKEFHAAWAAEHELVPGKQAIPPSGKVFDHEELQLAVNAVLDCHWTEGRFSKLFERDFGKIVQAAHVAVTNSGSSANLAAFMSLTSPKLGERRIRPGDEVIAVAAAFPATVNPIIQAGGIPVFLDVERETYNIDCALLEQAITPRTRAIFLAHTLGNPFNLRRVTEVARRQGLWLIEDCCDALGSLYEDRLVGTFGDLATFSFYPAHHITMGEGGAVVTNDAVLAKEVKSVRDWGRDCWCMPGCENTCGKRFAWKLGSLPEGYDHKYIYSNLGYNLKATDMQIALGLAQLRKLERFIAARKENFSFLLAGLKKWERYLQLPKATPGAEPSWFGFLLSVRQGFGFSRKELTGYLNEKKIGTRLLFAGNITKQPYFQGINYRVVGSLQNTDYVMENTFWIGVYPGISRQHLEYVISCFAEFFRLRGLPAGQQPAAP